jgi:hypothetical protein
MPEPNEFADLESYMTAEQHQIVSEAILRRELKEQLLRGMYSNTFLLERFFGRATPDDLKRLIAECIKQLGEEEPLDVRAEIIGYLGSVTNFKNTLYEMLPRMSNPLDTKNKLETIKLIHLLDNDRLAFIDRLGLLKPEPEEKLVRDFSQLDRVGDELERRLETGSQGAPRTNRKKSSAVEEQ